jgi:hypothetical protein
VPSDLTYQGRAVFLSRDRHLVLVNPNGSACDLPMSGNLASIPVRALLIAPGGAYVAVTTPQSVLFYKLSSLQESIRTGPFQAEAAYTFTIPNVKAAYWEPHGKPLLLCLSASQVSCMHHRGLVPGPLHVSILLYAAAMLCMKHPIRSFAECLHYCIHLGSRRASPRPPYGTANVPGGSLIEVPPDHCDILCHVRKSVRKYVRSSSNPVVKVSTSKSQYYTTIAGLSGLPTPHMTVIFIALCPQGIS